MQEADFGEAIVIGTRNSSSGGGGGGGGGSGGGGNYQEENRILPDPPPQPTQLPLVPVAEHEEDCSEADGAAVDMANRVKGGSGQSDPLRTGSGRTWQTVELGALLIRNDDGTFGAANDTIYSNDSANAVALPSPTGFSRAEGILHNHPYQQGNELSRNLSRFPSPADFAYLEYFAGQPGANPNPSAYIMDSRGVVREFRLSDRSRYDRDWNTDAAYELDAITDEDLRERERVEPCND